MLINPSLNEEIIFDFQRTIDIVHPNRISSRSDYCITTHIIGKTQKMPQKWQVPKIGVCSSIYSKNQIFPGHAVFARCYIMLSLLCI